MISTRIFLLIATLIVVANSQSLSVNPITTDPVPTNLPISLTRHIIKVGYMDRGFSRNNFTATKGNVLFWEWEGNLEHSVVESTLEAPCVKKDGGFDLGSHKEPYNFTMAVEEDRTYVFFSGVSDDCKNGMYGGINLPSGYDWPKDLNKPPEQIVTTPLDQPTPTPTPTGSMSILAAAENTQSAKASSAPVKEGSKSSASISYDINIIRGLLAIISLYFIIL